MMLDSSAVIAIVLREPEARALVSAIDRAPVRIMSAVNWVEAMVVAESRRGAAEDVRLALAEFDVKLVAFDEKQALYAYQGWLRFGKGRHPAALNFGDCCAYAAAVTSGEPLLFKGDDFPRTDVTPAPW
ncbi:MAG TPA: type II toxin-antitoxin system VapC family toxin [Terriglobales bacterium]|jgi:ribonuclease VapC